jgi:hypothetical protein
LLACRALDEGLDVPTVDGAILVASTQSRRALIQRIGRTLRQQQGKLRPVIVLLYAKGTSDSNVRIDPDDPYFNTGARIFDESAGQCAECVRGLIAGRPPLDEFELVLDQEKNPRADVLGCLAENHGKCLRLKLFNGKDMVGTSEGVLRRGMRLVLKGYRDRVFLSDIRQLYRRDCRRNPPLSCDDCPQLLPREA